MLVYRGVCPMIIPSCRRRTNPRVSRAAVSTPPPSTEGGASRRSGWEPIVIRHYVPSSRSSSSRERPGPARPSHERVVGEAAIDGSRHLSLSQGALVREPESLACRVAPVFYPPLPKAVLDINIDSRQALIPLETTYHAGLGGLHHTLRRLY